MDIVFSPVSRNYKVLESCFRPYVFVEESSIDKFVLQIYLIGLILFRRNLRTTYGYYHSGGKTAQS